MSTVQFISRPEGRIAYTVDGALDAPLVVLVPSEHPRAASTSTTIRDLASEPIVTLKPGYGLRGSLDDLSAPWSVEAAFTPETDPAHLELGRAAHAAWSRAVDRSRGWIPD